MAEGNNLTASGSQAGSLLMKSSARGELHVVSFEEVWKATSAGCAWAGAAGTHDLHLHNYFRTSGSVTSSPS